MQIGNQPGPSRSTLTGGPEAAPLIRVNSPATELQELQLEALTPEQLSQVRTYLSEVNQGAGEVRSLTPDVIPGLDHREHQKMQRGYRTLSDGGNIFQLLDEKPQIAEKIGRFVEGGRHGQELPPLPQPTTANDPVQIFLQSFDHWDTNHDGALDRSELGRVLQDTSLTPEQGAAFAVIYDRCINPRHDSAHPENNEPDLLADGRLTREEVQSVTGRTGSYQRNLQKIQNSPDQAFVGPPDGDAVRQGRYGSCAFLAALIAMAENDPAAVQRMIHDNGDGSWNVTFPGHDPIRVTLSPAERALGSTSDAQGGQNGLWVAILEKAYAQLKAGPGAANPLEIYNDGENERETSRVLSGQSIDHYELGATGLGGMIQQTVVRRAIERALLEGRPVTCALQDQSNPWHLPTSHAYTVLNLRGDNITVRNPWGDQGGEGNQNPDTGWTPDGQGDGRITIPFNDFCRYFREVNC